MVSDVKWIRYVQSNLVKDYIYMHVPQTHHLNLTPQQRHFSLGFLYPCFVEHFNYDITHLTAVCIPTQFSQTGVWRAGNHIFNGSWNAVDWWYTDSINDFCGMKSTEWWCLNIPLYMLYGIMSNLHCSNREEKVHKFMYEISLSVSILPRSIPSFYLWIMKD